jgi:hypothetical protein
MVDNDNLAKIITESIDNTLNEMRLREQIKKIVRECVEQMINEGGKKKKSSSSEIKRFFDKPGINNAQYAYKLAGVKPRHGKDTKEMKNARSLFAKKKSGFVDKLGNKYKFTPKEMNRLTSLISNNKLSEDVDKPKDGIDE